MNEKCKAIVTRNGPGKNEKDKETDKHINIMILLNLNEAPAKSGDVGPLFLREVT